MAKALVRHPFSVSDYHRMAETGILAPDARNELINGEVVQMAPIGSRHFACVNRLDQLLQRVAGKQAIVSVQGPIVLDEHSEPQPDIALLVPRADYYATQLPGPSDTLLVIEVSDTTLAYDLGVKAPRYSAAGVPACWIVDFAADEVLVLDDPTPDGYRNQRRTYRGERLGVDEMADAVLAVDDILGPSGR